MTALMQRPARQRTAPNVCLGCNRVKKARRSTRIPLGFPENQNPGSIIETFERHPWLEDSPLGALAQSMRDAVISA